MVYIRMLCVRRERESGGCVVCVCGGGMDAGVYGASESQARLSRVTVSYQPPATNTDEMDGWGEESARYMCGVAFV